MVYEMRVYHCVPGRLPALNARFANITASFGVEHVGVAGIPDREQVLAYMAAHPFEYTPENRA